MSLRDEVLGVLGKHYGPGPHPDGTPQSVHGGGRGGQFSDTISRAARGLTLMQDNTGDLGRARELLRQINHNNPAAVKSRVGQALNAIDRHLSLSNVKQPPGFQEAYPQLTAVYRALGGNR